MKKTVILLVSAVAVLPVNAKDFFDTSHPEKQFTIGARVGVNTTNRNVNDGIFDEWNCNSWGTGFDAGAVVDINLRDYISIQPGFYFESRSGKYAYANSFTGVSGAEDVLSQFGSLRSYNFTIPVMASIHFNITDDVRWNVEAGPYAQIVLKNTVNGKFRYPSAVEASGSTGFGEAKASNFDFGCKFGSSLTIKRHYAVGFAYEAGWLNVWKETALSGRNKGWLFYIGYDF